VRRLTNRPKATGRPEGLRRTAAITRAASVIAQSIVGALCALVSDRQIRSLITTTAGRLTWALFVDNPTVEIQKRPTNPFGSASAWKGQVDGSCCRFPADRGQGGTPPRSLLRLRHRRSGGWLAFDSGRRLERGLSRDLIVPTLRVVMQRLTLCVERRPSVINSEGEVGVHRLLGGMLMDFVRGRTQPPAPPKPEPPKSPPSLRNATFSPPQNWRASCKTSLISP
jgi:hypothetical protein